jgi:hypothetical protein
MQKEMNAPPVSASELKSRLVAFEDSIRQGIVDGTVMQKMTKWKSEIVRLVLVTQ